MLSPTLELRAYRLAVQPPSACGSGATWRAKREARCAVERRARRGGKRFFMHASCSASRSLQDAGGLLPLVPPAGQVAASTSWGQCRLSSSMFHCSANHANWVAVLIHPPMPTILPSALASAAAMQCIIGCCFSERTLDVAKHCASHVRAARLSLRRCSSLRWGSCSRTHCGLCDGGTLGTELLPVIAMLPTSRTLAPSGSHMPIGLCVTTALSSSASRKVCQELACTLRSVPLPLCRSLYRGAMYGRSCGQVVVAHISRPRALSKSFLGIFLLRASSCNCCCNLSSLPAARMTVSKSKLKVHPHAPGYFMAELCLLPADWRVDSCEKT